VVLSRCSNAWSGRGAVADTNRIGLADYGPSKFPATYVRHHHSSRRSSVFLAARDHQMPSLAQTWALPAAFLATAHISATWYYVVSKEVPNPYLVRPHKGMLLKDPKRHRTYNTALG
jgi:hypothetical protein